MSLADSKDVPLKNRLPIAIGQDSRATKNGPEEKNPYIPQFISKAPWYAKEDAESYLAHQRLQSEEKVSLLSEEAKLRSPTELKAATKYRKGACENCGAMTHKTKDCLERPRKRGARWTGKDIRADEVYLRQNDSWSAKRDRWANYDSREYSQVIEMHEKLEEIRKVMKQEGSEDCNEKLDDQDDQRGETSKTLRVREDKAKYIIDISSESQKYDPKSRKILEHDTSDVVASEGFVGRASKELENRQVFAWDSERKTRASDTKANVKDCEKKSFDEKLDQRLTELRSKYNVASTEILKELALPVEEDFVEYANDQGILQPINAIPKSSYPEDQFCHNHSKIYGSYWCEGKWGYDCCKQILKNSWCTKTSGDAI